MLYALLELRTCLTQWNFSFSFKENSDAGGNISKSPWVYVAENVQQDLLSYFENVRNEMEVNNVEEVKPSLTAKFGKILFHG